MLRNFRNLEYYLNRLLMDDYGQEPDPGHTMMAKEVFDEWIVNVRPCANVLDVGCGATGFAENFFAELGIEYTGIALSKDYLKAKALGKNVHLMDMNFLEFEDNSFDLIWARHVVEHSPMPLLTLMELHRVARNWLCLIVPKPDYYGRTGLNHYSVLYDDQWKFLLDRSGWHVVWEKLDHEQEYRFFAEKRK